MKTLTQKLSRTRSLQDAAGRNAGMERLEPRTLLAADLVADSVSISPSNGPFEPGEVVRVTTRFSNEGDALALPFRIQVRLSENATFGDADDVVLGSVMRLLPLPADTSASRTRGFELPDDLEPGEYRVGFLLDSRDVVDEDDESNNSFVSDDALIVVGDAEEPDVEVTGNAAVIEDGDSSPRAGDGTAFGRADVDGERVERTYVITNVGGGTLNIDDISIEGRHADSFEVVSSSDDSLDAGETAVVVIAFDPDSAGNKRAVVSIESDDPDEGNYTFAISGRGVADEPEIDITADGPITDGDLVASPNDGTHLGVSRVGQSVEQTFTITNSGSGDLILSTPFVTLSGRGAGQFSIIDMPTETTLAAGESTTFTVRFSPTSPGTKKAVVRVLSNDANEGTFDFEIRGRGRPAQSNGGGNG
jgi:hypothetical protein